MKCSDEDLKWVHGVLEQSLKRPIPALGVLATMLAVEKGRRLREYLKLFSREEVRP